MAEEKGKKEEKKDDKGKGAPPAEGAEGEEGEKKKKPMVFKIIIISSIALVLLAIVVFVSWKVAQMTQDPYSGGKPEKKDEERKSTLKALKPFRLGSKEMPDFKMVVTDRGEQHNLKCVIWLGYSKDYDKKGQDFFNELTDRIPMLREIVYRVIGSKDLEALQIKNLDHVEEELLSRMNEVLENGSIVDIMFEEYIIQ
ncbi:MAG: hypothetical protein A3G34_15005 [Candidatus Lindowbacteria bacterium RIFCSPLOWO2_12_FULL_62_27]|nr:MAG: hypothetical protein A3G34_15005 [Candidatus Lindowbacteria bacterium RIFCSPLOWO2_12_FULL_62_27]OGH63838.1 MAG: hypothetical protein A3I06_05975 [Candidatus Lindowbacteria bacterium RIFCSPLOWO2_02_FULL_62_12]